MTNTETTTHNEIGKQLERLKDRRERVCSIDDVLRWMDELDRGLSSAKEITTKSIEFRRSHDSHDHREYFRAVSLPKSAHRVVLLLARDHWQSMIPPLEKWLDERQIEHVESAKAD